MTYEDRVVLMQMLEYAVKNPLEVSDLKITFGSNKELGQYQVHQFRFSDASFIYYTTDFGEYIYDMWIVDRMKMAAQ